MNDGAESEPGEQEREPLRILRVATDTYPELIGGGALHVHKMSAGQAEMGHDVTLVTSDHGDRSLPRREERDGYHVRRYRQVARPFGNSITPGMVTTLRRLIDEADVVHAHSHLYFSTNVTAALSLLSETPLVVTNHGLYSQTAPGVVQSVFMRTVARFTFEAADRVLCYTETDERRLRELGVGSEIAVINNGVDCEEFAPKPATERRNEVLFVGRLNRNKGAHRLVEAFAAIADEFPETTLRIVGTGPMGEELEAMVDDHGLGGRVELSGRVENEALADVYAESAVFVLPSQNEGLPRTVLEAMACGTPVVTSDLPQLEPVVEGAGLTVSPRRREELSAALRELLADSERRREMGAVGRERVLAEYSWAETVRATTQTYYDLLE